MVSVELKGFDKLEDWMKELEKKLVSRERLLKIIGRRVVNEAVFDHFKEKKGPDGALWVPVKPKYAAYKQSKGKSPSNILEWSGNLKRSVRYFLLGSSGVAIGVDDPDVPYAAAHNFGYKKKNIPARPFLGIGEKEKAIVSESVTNWLRSLL